MAKNRFEQKFIYVKDTQEVRYISVKIKNEKKMQGLRLLDRDQNKISELESYSYSKKVTQGT